MFRQSHLYKRLFYDGGHKGRQNPAKDLVFLLKSEATLKLDSLKKNTSQTITLALGECSDAICFEAATGVSFDKMSLGWQFLAQKMGQMGILKVPGLACGSCG